MAEGGPKKELSREAKFEEAKKLKDEGNEFFKNKNSKKAVSKYHRALLFIKGLKQNKCGLPLTAFMAEFNGGETPIDEQLLEKAVKLEVDCYNNLAACLLLMSPPNYEKILSYCEQVLELESYNTKALYRRGVSLYHLKNTDAAMESLNLAKDHGGANDGKIKKYIDLCQKELDKQEEKLKATYKGMFGKLGQENGDGDS